MTGPGGNRHSTTTDAFRAAAEYRRPFGRIPPDAAGEIAAYLQDNPEVSDIHEGDFGVLHATVDEHDGTRYVQAYTAAGLLAKLKRLRRRPGPSG